MWRVPEKVEESSGFRPNVKKGKSPSSRGSLCRAPPSWCGLASPASADPAAKSPVPPPRGSAPRATIRPRVDSDCSEGIVGIMESTGLGGRKGDVDREVKKTLPPPGTSRHVESLLFRAEAYSCRGKPSSGVLPMPGLVRCPEKAVSYLRLPRPPLRPALAEP